MAIKNVSECISIFDPNLKTYHEVNIEDLRCTLKSLGLVDSEVDKIIRELKTGEKINEES